ncbi:MAG TPA: tetratricopeptide repeat protein [Burkholderiales bacterium]|nr:tetratricopeptide repeat protein [Burkholderiales bacterium]
MAKPDPLLAQALAAHRAGQLPQARDLYRRVLEADPRNVDALNLLGVLHSQTGDLPRACEALERAVAAKPQYAEANANLGMVLRQAGRAAEAEAACRRAIALKPELVEAHNNLGAALEDRGAVAEAAASYRRAAQLQPGRADVRFNLANALTKLGEREEAAAIYRSILALAPNYVPALINLARIEAGAGRESEAEALFARALSLDPENGDARAGLGVIALGNGEYEKAAELLGAAGRSQPERSEWHRLGALALQRLGRHDEAAEGFRRALDADAGNGDAWIGRVASLASSARQEEALEAAREGLKQLDGRVLDSEEDRERWALVHSALMLSLNYADGVAPREIFHEHRRWDEIHARPLAPAHRPRPAPPEPERRLRIGYVSADFYDHPVACFLEPIFANHDRERFEVFLYSGVARADAVTDRFRGYADGWRDLARGRGAEDARRIAEDRIDILVDLGGHMGGFLLLFARGPAPLAVSYLGYPCTSGLSLMDWRLTDARADPPETQPFSSERLLHLPGSYFCYRPPADTPDPVAPPALRAGRITFGSFNNPAKITRGAVAHWAAVLRAVPDSRLLLKAGGMDQPAMQARLRGRFAEEGIGAERLEFRGVTKERAGHLATFNEVDIALDSWPYNGATTTCEALWMGVPVVSLRGATHASRMGWSLLSAAGLPEIATASPGEFVAAAAALASDAERLAALRRELRGRFEASPLRDEAGFTRSLELAYRRIWRECCAAGG